MGIKYYYTSVTGSMEIKKHQQKIEMILDSKKVEYEKIDIAINEEDRAKMREVAGNEKALPPQITIDDTYCGDYTAFDIAVEAETLDEFLQLK